VVHRPGAQIAILDTPGLHKPQHQLNRRMVRTTMDCMREADLFYVMVEATAPPGPGDRFAIDQVAEARRGGLRPAFLLINKVDAVNKTRLLPLIESYRRLLDWDEIVPLSAMDGTNLDRLLDLTVARLPEGETQYEEDMLTDQPMRRLAAEIVREKILRLTRDEVPHAVAVEITRFQEEGKLARIQASILVEKESQKAIVIGKHGERLKTVGTEARIEMEKLFGMKVFLELWVKVKAAWREDEQALVELGY
jgi:GTP-binding protein Era